ncbi:hypothetical protein NPIL_681611 [Nephila pilipes]|uniref:Uncharacterized protein n=1 Tax=Nephila pilipes TaxID=299642 RepID=A0A8X6MWQ2_NEPPI|nr:hypothetical protein NPIL_681611 [Nephila pilipes]
MANVQPGATSQGATFSAKARQRFSRMCWLSEVLAAVPLLVQMMAGSFAPEHVCNLLQSCSGRNLQRCNLPNGLKLCKAFSSARTAADGSAKISPPAKLPCGWGGTCQYSADAEPDVRKKTKVELRDPKLAEFEKDLTQIVATFPLTRTREHPDYKGASCYQIQEQRIDTLRGECVYTYDTAKFVHHNSRTYHQV